MIKMKKMFMAILIVGLSILLFSRCSTPPQINSGISSNKGVFVQSIISPSADEELSFLNLEQLDNGSILLTALDELFNPYIFIGDGTENWKEMKNDTAGQLIKEILTDGLYPVFTIAEDETWWVAQSSFAWAYDDEADVEKQLVKIYAVNGSNKEEIEVDFIKEINSGNENYSIDKLIPGKNNSMHILLTETENRSKAYWITVDVSTGEETSRILVNPKDNNLHNSVISGEKIYIPNKASNQLVAYSLKTGEEAEKMTMPNMDYDNINLRMDIASNEDVCYISNSGIHRISWNGTLVQDMVTGNRYVFSSSLFHCGDFLALEDGSYLLIADDEHTSNVYRFEFDENADLGATEYLTIWALEDSHILRGAVSAYSKKNPNASIKIEYGRSADSSGTTDEDIIRTLNTALIAGDVPDILILDGLPAATYIEQGLLADIGGKIDISNCYENIMQAFTQDEKAYAYPTLFQMPVFIGTAGDEHAGGISSLEELAKLAGEQGALHYGSYLEMFESLYSAFSSTIFPAASRVDENALREFLSSTKTISDELALTDENTYIYGGVGNSDINPRQGVSAFSERGANYAADILWEPGYITTLFMFENREISPLPGGCFIPVCSAAIPVGAANENTAVDFINIMLKDDNTQETQMEQGFSVVKGYHMESYKHFEENKVGKPSMLDWDLLISQFTGPAITEKVLQEKLYEQAELLYKNNIAVDEAVSNVMKNTKLYFDERR